MTKVEAIKKILEDHNGIATWSIVYDEIEKYYPSAKEPKDWQAALRGVFYREEYSNRVFKKVGLDGNNMIALLDYKEEKFDDVKNDEKKMHAFMEGVCLEIGNSLKLKTFTADPSKIYNSLPLSEIASISVVPSFTYPEIVSITKRIDVLWFNDKGFRYPKRTIEIVDSIGTLEPALKRSIQLIGFNLSSYILCKSTDVKVAEKALSYEPYVRVRDRFKVRDYDSILQIYEKPFSHTDDDFLSVESSF
jgi:hypothetical protein